MAQANEQDPNTQTQDKPETPAQKKKRLAAEEAAAKANVAGSNPEPNKQADAGTGSNESQPNPENSGTADTQGAQTQQSNENDPGTAQGEKQNPLNGDNAGDLQTQGESQAADTGNNAPVASPELIQTPPTLGTSPEDEPKETEALGPLELRITNNGASTHCSITRIALPAKQTVNITYPNSGKKSLAQKNFAQLNALAGKKNRFEVEG